MILQLTYWEKDNSNMLVQKQIVKGFNFEDKEYIRPKDFSDKLIYNAEAEKILDIYYEVFKPALLDMGFSEKIIDQVLGEINT